MAYDPPVAIEPHMDAERVVVNGACLDPLRSVSTASFSTPAQELITKIPPGKGWDGSA